MIKRLLFTALLLAVSASTGWAQAQEVLLGSNSYITNPNQANKVRISNDGIGNWSGKEIISTYFLVQGIGNLDIDLKIVADGKSAISITVEGEKFNVDVPDAPGEQVLKVGTINIKNPGYIKVDMIGVRHGGSTYGKPSALLVDGEATKAGVQYVRKDFSSHFGRRGPSVHLSYPFPEGETIEWFYNEVTVSEGDDVLGSYFMSNGFGEGYFGIQVNSEQERRILFSLWSPYVTDRPKEIPDSMKINLIRKGEGVHSGEFGGEGSGGQSRLSYMWKASTTYGFLTRIRPTGKNTTIYTSYFYAPEKREWMLIAEFERPQTDTYYKRAHSFLENFSPSMGWVTRKGLYGNQWARTTDGRWIELTRARFTVDETASKQQRLDYKGGVTPSGEFFMQNGGFFNDNTEINSWFDRPANGKAPQIDFDKLP